MICVCLAEPTVRAVCAVLPLYTFAEIRLDAINNLTEKSIKRIFAWHPNLIATFRPGRVSEAKRLALLTAAVETGAAFVDIEIDAKPASIRKIVSVARICGCRPILSFHDMTGTPSRAVLENIRKRGFQCGADIVKIACLSGGAADNARLMGLLDCPKLVVAIGLGPAGQVTRIVAPLLGAPFTYASAAAGKETAPGQLEAALIQRTWEAWKNA